MTSKVNLLRVTMILIFVTFFSYTYSQDFRYPLNVPMSLSGNYGELRGNHFHGGIDRSEERRVGKEC